MDILPNPTIMLQHLLNCVILFVALRFLLYKPVRKFMETRSARLAQQFDEAQAMSKSASDKLAEYQAQLDGVAQLRARAAQEGAQRGGEQAEEIIARAREQADQIIAVAQRDVQAMRVNAQEALRAQAVDLALEISAQVLARELNTEDDRKLIEEFLSKVG